MRNIISANAFGIVLAAGAHGSVVQANYIGTDITGSVDLGNTGQGIEISDAPNNIIGDNGAFANVISGNGAFPVGADGIRVNGTLATGNLISQNIIGLNAAGTAPLPNSDDGIDVRGGATGNWIYANSIGSNGGLGIDLEPDGVTPNDAGDSDTGANNLQNFPVVTSAVNAGSSTLVTGTLASFGDASFRIDVFASDACDPSGNGEGVRFLGSDDVVTAPDGTATFSLNSIPTAKAGAGDFITTTATDQTGWNTSEFSACVAVTADVFTVTTTDDHDDSDCAPGDCTLREAINAANAVSGFQTISFAIPGTGQQTISPASALPPITDATTIDGTSQLGYSGTPLIVVDGSAAGAATDGLVLGFAPAASGSTIQGLAVVDFGGYGILVQGDNDVVLDNYVGTANGTSAQPNATGVRIDPGSDGSEVRGNLTSGNLYAGISSNGTGLLIAGNRIGTNFSADGKLGNGITGIFVGLPGGGTTIGGDTDLDPTLGNIIAGNIEDGIRIDGSGGNVVQGNLIGTNSEETDLGNGGAGVSIRGGAQGNRIGADQAGTSIPDQPANVIAFNAGALRQHAGRRREDLRLAHMVESRSRHGRRFQS